MKGFSIQVRNLRALLALCASIPFIAYAAGQNAPDARALWVALPQSVLKISPVDGSVDLQLKGTPSPQGFAVDETDEAVWIYGHRNLQSFDAEGNPLLNVQLPHDFDDDAPAGMAVDNSSGNVWIAINQHLYRLDMGGSVQSVIRLADEAQAISLDANQSQLWVVEGHGVEIFGSDGNGKASFSLGRSFHPEAVAYDSFLKQAWLLSDENLERVSATGQVYLQARMPGDLSEHLVPDGQGGLWVAGDHTLAYLDQMGATQFTLYPFDTDSHGSSRRQNGDNAGHDGGDGDHGEIMDLVADPLDHTAWVAGPAALRQFGTDGILKHTITVPGQRGHDGQDDEGSGVRHVALYVDTVPPTLSISAPQNGAFTNQNRPALVLSYSDIGSGVDPASVAVTSNGAPLAVTCIANTDDSGASCTPNAALPDGGYSLSLTVKDKASNASQPATASFTVDTVPPRITVSSPASTTVNQAGQVIAGSISEAGTLTINGNDVPVGADDSFSAALTFTPGNNTFTFVATDLAGNAATVTKTYDYIAIQPPNAGLITIADPVDGQAAVAGQAGAVVAGDLVIITNGRTGQSVTVTADAQGAFTASIPAQWGDPITVVSEDPKTGAKSAPTGAQTGSLPPSPQSVAPVLTPTGATPFSQGTAFLYSGSNPIQIGVAANTMQSGRVGVIRGTVQDTQGNALPGAVITVLNHPEYGYTVSRADGMFDMAVNGGQVYTVAYNKTGYLPVQRQVQVPWRDYAWAKTVSLTAPSPQVSPVAFGSTAPQFVSGAATSDADGTRTASLFIPAGVTAAMTMSDGSQVPLTSAHLRMTELTVGSNGQQAMPAELPQYTAYTYAIDYQLDEAVQQQAVHTVFSAPVYGYVTNFLRFPVGVVIPSGWYDMLGARWVPSDNGLVIQVLGVDGTGAAIVDVDGKGQAATASELSALNITAAELGSLARQYQPGTSLWRVPLKHFSLSDYNPYGARTTASALHGSASTPTPPAQTPPPDCNQSGCIVGPMHQTLGEAIPLTGTGQTLDYSSATVQTGQVPGRTLLIPVTGPDNHGCFGGTSCYTGLVDIELDIAVAGERIVHHFPPQPNQNYTFVWDGKDGYGRAVYGSVPVTTTVKYFTDISYVLIHNDFQPPSFGIPQWSGGGFVTSERQGQTVSVELQLGPFFVSNGAPQHGLALGWDLSSDAWYDYVAGVLHKGDGSTLEADSMSPMVVPLSYAATGYGAIAIGADNTTYAAQGAGIVAMARGFGAAQTFATLPSGGQIGTLRMGRDGNLYALDVAGGQIDAVTPAGVLTTVATGLQNSRSFDVLPGGGFVVAECGQLVAVAVDGTQTVIAGQGCSAAGVPASGLHALDTQVDPLDVATDQDGDVYFLQSSAVPASVADTIARISAGDGTVSIQYPSSQSQSGQTPLSAMTRLMYLSNGEVAVVNNGQIVVVDATGAILARTGGDGQPGRLTVSGSPAFHSLLNAVALAMSPDGSIEVLDSVSGLVDIRSALPVQDSDAYGIPSPDGSVVQTFDADGRLKNVLNSYTGATLESYQYDSVGRLVGETDAFGRTLTISRDGSGFPTAITSPDGQVTAISVDVSGNIVSVSDPAGDTWAMGYQADGLLGQYTDPRHQTDHYAYDAVGRLTQVQEPNGGGWTITRTDAGPYSYSITLKSGEGRVTQYAYNPIDTQFQCGPPIGGFNSACLFSALEITAPDGTVTRRSNPSWGGGGFTLAPDGTTVNAIDAPDPRFGDIAPIVDTTVTIPNGASGSLTNSVSITRDEQQGTDGLLNLTRFDQATTVNGTTTSLDSYDGTQLTWTHVTPMFRNIVTHVNTLGQPTELDLPSVAPITYSYDTAGRLSAVTQGSGTDARSSSYAYYAAGPSQGMLQQVTDPIGRTVGYQYDGAGRVTVETLPDGEQVQFGYDADGNLTSLTPPGRPDHGFDYNAANDVADYTPPAVTGVTNPATQYQYNLDRQLTQVTEPDGETVSLAYDTGGRLSTITLPTGSYQYAYVPVTGQLQSITSPDAETLTPTWAGPLDIGDTWSGPVAGSVTRTFDNFFRVTSLAVDGNAVTYSYNADSLIIGAGDLTFSRDAGSGFVLGTALDGIQSILSYDGFGAPATLQFASNGLSDISASLDHSVVTDGNLQLSVTLPGANAVSVNGQSYFLVGGSLSATIPLQQGDNPLAISVTDSSGNVVYTSQQDVTFNGAASSNSVNQILGIAADGTLYFNSGDGTASPIYLFTPGAAGPMQPDWLLDVTNLALGPGGVVYVVKPDGSGGHQLWAHMASGDQQIADFRARLISQMVINDQGQMVFDDFSNVYEVNSDGSVTLLQNLSGTNRSFPVRISASAWGIAVANTSTGDVFQLQDDGSLTLVENEPFNSLAEVNYNSIAVDGSGQLCFAYSNLLVNFARINPGAQQASALSPADPNAIPTFWCHQPGAAIQYYYTTFAPQTMMFGPDNTLYINDTGNIYSVSGGNLTGLLSGGPVIVGTLSITGSGGQLFSEQYTRDKVGRITEKVETVAGTATTWDYTYDPQGHLATVSQDSAVVETEGYDANGNRTTVNGAVVGSYDDQDRLLSFDGDSYSYTPNGQVQTDSWTNPDGTTGSQQYQYDATGNLTDVTLDDGTKVHYLLDGRNRRVGKEVNGTLVQGFLYQDQIAPVAELDGAGNVVQQYVYGTSPNVPDYIIQGSKEYRVITDQVGSVRLVVDAQSGAVVEEIDYDAWGNVSNDTNAGFQPFGFAGGVYDQDTGLYHFGARDYDPFPGRWMEKDPVGFNGGETSLYGYVGNDPIDDIDPTGLTDWSLPQWFVDASAGLGDALLLGQGDNLRQLLNVDGGVDKLSTAYEVGSDVSLALGATRLEYAGIAKVGSLLAESGEVASAFRLSLKNLFSARLTDGWRQPNLAKYVTDEELRAAAGRTNALLNWYAAGVAASAEFDKNDGNCR